MTYHEWLEKLRQIIGQAPTPTSLASLDPREYPYAKRVWATADPAATGDGSSKAKPLPLTGGDIDALIKSLGPSFRITLAPGNYSTSGVTLPRHASIVGAGIGSTTIRMRDGAANGPPCPGFPHCRVFSDSDWCFNLHISDLTIDCNWPQQTTAKANGNYKLDAIVVRTVRGIVERVEVINFGSNGKDYGSDGLECFPLFITTYASGAPFKYHAAHSVKASDPADVSYIEIRNCEVHKPHFINGGYCTAIMVQTSLPEAGDRQPFGLRETLAASVIGNYVHAPGGIAYGAAQSERVLWQDNVCFGAVAAFNFDTGQAANLQIIRNHFLGVNQGINVTAAANSKNVSIQRNSVLLKEPYFNPLLGKLTPFFWVKLANLPNEATGNFFGVLSKTATPEDSTRGDRNTVYL